VSGVEGKAQSAKWKVLSAKTEDVNCKSQRP
jgi:hypothetical protein